jgi:ligand-binding sensor domain-containing protein
MPDGTLWVGSFAWGLAQLDEAGTVLRYALNHGAERFVSALARDTGDDSLWAGHRWGGGLSRLKGKTLLRYEQALGSLAYHPVYDIQAVGTGPGRRLLVAFGRTASGRPGAVGIYTGE